MPPAAPTAAGRRVQEVARRLLYERGIRAVGVAEIVESSGVTKPSLYRNFESKAGLVVAYLNEQAAVDLEVVALAQAAHPNSPREQIRYIVSATGAKIAAPGYRGCPLANAAIEFPDRSHPIRVRVDEHKRSFLQMLTRVTGRLVPENPDELAFALAMLLEGASSTAQLYSAPQTIRALAASADAIVESHLARRVEPAASSLGNHQTGGV